MMPSRLGWLLGCFLLAGLAACQTTTGTTSPPPATSVDASALAFWTPPKDAGHCRASGYVVDLPTSPDIRGWNRTNTAVAFIKAVGRNMASAIADPRFDTPSFANAFVGAAKRGSFTRLDFEGPGGPSPVFTTSLVLISSAYAVSLFDHAGAWDADDRAAVIAWGARLDANQEAKREYASPDSIAAIAAARLTWGAATRQPEVFAKGLRDFERIGRMLDAKALFERNPRDNNEVVGTIVLAAEAATRSGVDAYGMRFNGKSLHDAILAHADQTLRIGAAPITESDTGHTGTYFRTTGFAAHLAWIPIYLHRFPDTPAAAKLRALITAVKAQRPTDPTGFDGTSLGGPTSCLWAR